MHYYSRVSVAAFTLVAHLTCVSPLWAGSKSYATMGMVDHNGTLCSTAYKHCGLFVSRATMTGNGTRDDGGAAGANGYATAQIICTEEGRQVDGGTHSWVLWLPRRTVTAAAETGVASSGARYYRAGTSVFVLDAESLTTT